MSRDTRVLLIIVMVAVTTLWILARIRFPDQAPTPNPVPPVLAQLAPPSAFEDIVAAVAQIQPTLQPWIVAVELAQRHSESSGRSTRRMVAALRFSGDLAVALVDKTTEPSDLALANAVEVARDPATQMAVIRLPGGGAAAPSTWSPRRIEYPRFLVAADVSREGTSFRPVFVGSLYATMSPLWSGPIWTLPASSDLGAGTFVFNVDGALAGLVVLRDGRAAIVPGDTVMTLADRLVRDGPRRPGGLGIHVQALTHDVAAAAGNSAGAIVTWVDPQGPAAGQVGVTDVIEGIDGKLITTLEQWEASVARLAPGDSVVLDVRRRGDLLEVSLTAAAVPAPSGDRPLGLTLRRLPRIGVQVVRVDPQSAASRAELAAGDVITRVNDIEAPTAAQVSRAFETPLAGPVLIGVTRGETHHVMALERTW